MMSDESYNHYLAIVGQMMFNVRNFLVHLLFSSMTIVPNTCFSENLHDVNLFVKVLGARDESCKGGQTRQTKVPSSY